jgi:predicted regulator of Ras-like GTPase activity (Roadblock/LC7/MglB family)
MVFDKILSDLVEKTPGAHAAMVMGYDGIPLDQYSKGNGPPFDLQTVGIEYCGVIHEIRKQTTQVGLAQEGVQEITVRSDSWSLLIRLINEEYFALLVLDSQGFFGKGRYLLRHAANQVRTQL